MKLTRDEHQALAFVAALVLVSAAVRVVSLPEPVALPDGALDLADHIEAVESAVAEAEEAARPLEPGETIDPNAAGETQLARLPRIGPRLAARIVAHRETAGPFRRLEDLTEVPGSGDRTLEVLAPHLALSSRLALVRAGAEGGGGSRPAAPLDLNRADAETLQQLPGIGPVLAGRIVAYRDSVGPFRTLAELAEVRGVGPAALDRLGGHVMVGRGR